METANFGNWSRLHATGALLGLGVAVAFGRLEPFLVVAALSLAFFFLRYRHPMNAVRGIGWANAITLSRLVIVTLAALASASDPFWTGLAVAISLVLDALDGFVARRLGECTPFGAHFDMEVDSYSTAVLCGALFVSGRFETWILIAGLLRYVWVIARAISAGDKLPERRSWIGRIAAIAMMTALLLSAVGPAEERWPLAVLATLLVSLSFSKDFLLLGRYLVGRHEPA